MRTVYPARNKIDPKMDEKLKKLFNFSTQLFLPRCVLSVSLTIPHQNVISDDKYDAIVLTLSLALSVSHCLPIFIGHNRKDERKMMGVLRNRWTSLCVRNRFEALICERTFRTLRIRCAVDEISSIKPEIVYDLPTNVRTESKRKWAEEKK